MKNQKGFTLVELMIVVAIIGILAAIAIPQFAAYRIRGFNASALSDTKNLQTAEASFFADNQLYAITGAATALATPAAGNLLTGPQSVANSIISQWVGGAIRPMGIGIGNGVTVLAKNNATATAYNAGAKHTQGDTVYGVDSDSTLTYGNAALAGQGTGTVLLVTSVIDPVIGTDEYAAAGAPWVAK